MNRDPGDLLLRKFCFFAFFFLLLTGISTAQETPYGAPQPYWPNQYAPSFRPLPETNAQGIPSTNGAERYAPRYGYPQSGVPAPQYPNPWGPPTGQQIYGYDSSPEPATAPKLRVIYPTKPVYVQQTLVLVLEVSSDSNLKSIDPILPNTDALVFRKLGNWDAHTQPLAGGRTKIVNRLNYLVTPVRSGHIDLGKFNVKGEFSNGQRFSSQSSKSLSFDVLPPDPSVNPWLPLAEFDVSARLINSKAAEKGKPVTLIIEQKAIGITGNQLPSLEARLRQGHYRLYLENTQHAGKLTEEGKLVGTRVDTFTLIALPNRELLIPAINLTWWNTRTHERESTILPSRLLSAPGGIMANLSKRLSGGPFVAGSAWVFWLPLTVFAFVVGLYWTWIWARGRRFGQRFRYYLSEQLEPIRSKTDRLLGRISPRRHLHNLRRKFADSLPRSARLWYCVRAADQESDPAIWSLVLRFLVQRRLNIPAQVPMSQLAEIIIDIHPLADATKIRSLLRELNGAVFGNNQIEDFAQWKRAFKSQVRPRIAISHWIRMRHIPTNELPGLNP